MKRTLTLVVHGTFAKEAEWWRLSADGNVTFADQLEREMTRCGVSGTVWAPLLSEGFDYDAIAWTGQNRHRDRVKAAKQLSATLNAFAERVHANPNEPVVVNFVAHSHGGNVVLEALRRFNPAVQVGRIALLGTPLIKVRPAFRLARPFLSVLLSALLVGMVAMPFVLAFSRGTIPETTVPILGHPVSIFALVIPLLIGYAWIFWLLGNLLDTCGDCPADFA